jgi:hypothetical protein
LIRNLELAGDIDQDFIRDIKERRAELRAQTSPTPTPRPQACAPIWNASSPQPGNKPTNGAAQRLGLAGLLVLRGLAGWRPAGCGGREPGCWRPAVAAVLRSLAARRAGLWSCIRLAWMCVPTFGRR